MGHVGGRWGGKRGDSEVKKKTREERGKERRCECPQGESESEHPSLLRPADVL